MPQGLTMDKLAIGQSHSKTLTLTQEMMIAFTHSLGDHSSFHQDPEMAKDSYYGRMVAPGMLTGSLIGFVLGTEFPGLGTIYVSQDLKFLRPVFAGDEVVITVSVTEMRPDGKRVRLETVVANREGQVVVRGQAEIIPPNA